MQRTANLEMIVKQWESNAITNWLSIQENVAHITLIDGRQIVLKGLGKVSEEKIGRLQFEYAVLHHVAQMGMAVALPRLSHKGTPYLLYSDELYRLSDWLPNEPLEEITEGEKIQLYQNYGAAIGRFHQALATFKEEQMLRQTWQTDLQQRIVNEAVPVILANLAPPQQQPFQTLLADIQPAMTKAVANLPRQLIIWDCHPGNVAVAGLEVTGFVDCDHLSIAPRVFDLADFLVHLIKWDIGNEEKEQAWLTDYPQLIAGYEQVTQLSRRERAALFYVMLGIPLIFMDFFLQNNLPALVQREFDLFVWLVGQRQTITTQLEGGF